MKKLEAAMLRLCWTKPQLP